MTHWKTQFNYDYLGAYSLPDGKDIILTIRETKKEQVVGASGKKEECFVAYFFENVKPMILNRTNCKTLTKIFKNPNFESWINKQIQIGAVLVDAFGEKVDSLRIRPFLPKVENSCLLLRQDRQSGKISSTVWRVALRSHKSRRNIN